MVGSGRSRRCPIRLETCACQVRAPAERCHCTCVPPPRPSVSAFPVGGSVWSYSGMLLCFIRTTPTRCSSLNLFLSHTQVLSAYSWRCTGDPLGCWRANLGRLRAKPTLPSLCKSFHRFLGTLGGPERFETEKGVKSLVGLCRAVMAGFPQTTEYFSTGKGESGTSRDWVGNDRRSRRAGPAARPPGLQPGAPETRSGRSAPSCRLGAARRLRGALGRPRPRAQLLRTSWACVHRGDALVAPALHHQLAPRS